MASTINPAVVLKRKHSDDDINDEWCLICQRKSQEHLKAASEHGWQRVLSVAQEREQFNDTAYPIVIKNIHSVEQLDFSNTSGYSVLRYLLQTGSAAFFAKALTPITCMESPQWDSPTKCCPMLDMI